MSTYKIFENGATWLRADFHLHTKADSEFKYSGDNFILDYMNSLKQAEIHIGVITNHNKFDFEEFKELQKEALKHEIYLLPGVEFSIKDGSRGIHLLIVFSEEWIFNKENKNDIQDFLISSFNGIKNPESPPYPNSNYGLKETYESLNKFKKDYFFVLAHVDEKNGLFEELSGRNLEAFVKQEAFQKVLVIQKSGNKDNYDKLCKLAGRKIACVEGTDNAQAGIEGIRQSQKFSYLKIGDYNFDAVKFALVANRQRVALKEKPQIKNDYIKSIEFVGGLFDKQKITFSPELNSLIGIRGSGKSAIIEILRDALGIPFTKTSVDQEYKRSLVEYVMGSGGKVIVELVNKHGDIYKIEKIQKEKETIYKDGNLLPGITFDAIIDKPVYFGQKDLSNKDADFESDLLHRLIGNKLNNLKKEIEQKNIEIKDIIFQLQKSKNLEEQKKEAQTAIENAKHQLELFKKHGIEEKLKTQTDYEKDISTLHNFKENIKTFIDALNEILEGNKSLFDANILLSETNESYIEPIKSIFDKFKAKIQSIEKESKSLSELFIEFEAIISEIIKNKDALKEEFAKIKRELNQPNLNPDQFLVLNRIINTNEAKIKEIEKLEEQKKKKKDELSNKLIELNNLWYQEFSILKNEIDKINQNRTKLTIEIEYKGRKDKFYEELKNTFRGSNIRDNIYSTITKQYSDFIGIYLDKSKLRNILNPNQYVEFEKRFDENLSDLLTFRVKDKITIKYNGKELSSHSLGQRASALILFLLSQKEQNILIIDQPEDDLDNQTIYDEVIREMHKLKGSMQFIFATHNANIPVLGDSEQVVVCNYEENKITVTHGSIDMPEIQKHIVNIMEGGVEAFNRRKDIYNIWKP